MTKIKAIRPFKAKAKGSHDGTHPLHDLPEIQIGDVFEAKKARSLKDGRPLWHIKCLPEVRYPADAFVEI